MHPAQNQGGHTQPKPHSHSPVPGPWEEGCLGGARQAGAGVLLEFPELGQQQKAQAWVVSQIHHNQLGIEGI